MKPGIAGTLESNDAVFTVRPASTRHVVIHSVVDAFYHEQIARVIETTLDELGIAGLDVLCEDKGALDYTLRARLIAAIRRMEV
jgi:citrate lyase subunit gamma (acyl carrier protein)